MKPYDRLNQPAPPLVSSETFAPLRAKGSKIPWEGPFKKTPHKYSTTAVIPVLDTPEELALVVQILELQTVKPFIVIVDTGSTDENLAEIIKLRSETVEVHSLRFNGVKHPSDFVAIAMDFAQNRCQTEWLFCTHADCFLKKQNVIEEFIAIAEREGNPAVGYQISPRPHEGWEGMISHTATLLNMRWCLQNGVSWNQWRCMINRGYSDHSPDPARANMPDTEVNLNDVLCSKGVDPYLVDADNPVEHNQERNEDHRIDHARSLTSAKIQQNSHLKKAQPWADDAMLKARSRIEKWKSSNLVRQHSLNLSPYRDGLPLMISGSGQGGTTAVMRSLASGMRGMQTFFLPESRNAEDDLMLAMRKIPHEDKIFDFTKVFNERMKEYGSKWITKIPQSVKCADSLGDGVAFNWLIITRDPLASTLSFIANSDHIKDAENQFMHRRNSLRNIQVAGFALAKDTGVLFVDYESLMLRTEGVLTEISKWMGAEIDLEKAMEQIIPRDPRYKGDFSGF